MPGRVTPRLWEEGRPALAAGHEMPGGRAGVTQHGFFEPRGGLQKLKGPANGSPLGAAGRSHSCPHLDLSPEEFMLDFCTSELI